MKKNLLVTLADRNYVEQAKQLFSSVYWNAGWKGDYMLLAHEIPEKELKWFRKKGILVKKCKPIKVKKDGKTKEFVHYAKLYIFTPEFKKWKNILFLDADIIIRNSLKNISNTKGFLAVQDFLLEGQFKGPYLAHMIALTKSKLNKKKKMLLKEIKKRHDMKKKSFNSGVMAFSTDIITEKRFQKLKKLLRYSEVSEYWEQSILNLFFYNKWKEIPLVFNADGYILRKSRVKIKPAVIHFMGEQKAWQKNNEFYSKWKENLKKADEICLSKYIPAREKLSKKEIALYSRQFQKERKRIVNKKLRKILIATNHQLKLIKDLLIEDILPEIKRHNPFS